MKLIFLSSIIFLNIEATSLSDFSAILKIEDKLSTKKIYLPHFDASSMMLAILLSNTPLIPVFIKSLFISSSTTVLFLNASGAFPFSINEDKLRANADLPMPDFPRITTLLHFLLENIWNIRSYNSSLP